MAAPKVRHAFVSGKSDGADATLVKPSNWNAALQYTDSSGAPSGTDAQIREKISADRTYYVRTDGSDSNSGLVDNAGGAFLTIGKAMSVVAQDIDANGHVITIQVRSGTYSELVVPVPYISSGGNGGVHQLIGDASTPSNCVITQNSVFGTIWAFGAGVDWMVKGFKVTNATGPGINGHAGAWIRMSNMEIGACGTAAVLADHGGTIELQGDLNISGNSPIGVSTTYGGYFLNTGNTVTLTGTPAFATAFANCTLEGRQFWLSGSGFSGSGTGKRYNLASGGNIDTASGGSTFFPGNSAGTNTNGFYDGTLEIASLFPAWTSYSPTITATSGTFTTVGGTAYYMTMGKTTWFTCTVNITTAGTASGGVVITLPNTCAQNCILLGRESTATGNSLSGTIFASGTSVTIFKYDNTTIIASGRDLTVSGVYTNT